MCSPARSTLMSGYFPAQHGVKYTLEENMPAEGTLGEDGQELEKTYPQVELPTDLANLATVMRGRRLQRRLQGQVALLEAGQARGSEARPTSKSTASCAGTRPTPAPTRPCRRRAAATSTTTAASSVSEGSNVEGSEGVLRVPRRTGARGTALLPRHLTGQPARRPLLPQPHLRRSGLRPLLAGGRNRGPGDQRRRPLDEAEACRKNSSASSTSPASRTATPKSAAT